MHVTSGIFMTSRRLWNELIPDLSARVRRNRLPAHFSVLVMIGAGIVVFRYGSAAKGAKGGSVSTLATFTGRKSAPLEVKCFIDLPEMRRFKESGKGCFRKFSSLVLGENPQVRPRKLEEQKDTGSRTVLTRPAKCDSGCLRSMGLNRTDVRANPRCATLLKFRLVTAGGAITLLIFTQSWQERKVSFGSFFGSQTPKTAWHAPYISQCLDPSSDEAGRMCKSTVWF
ncbi:hypothetical protein MPH_04566 [Macrophomina phaseolina MS6]|uniref:Uncharacterized protein n=1 Tax=Macrophomina phaseolina (strain MS6) TaxID=1126212 RepID=K2RZN9_MACPH|nr:hypothetical protein MPH_04566 [Macrophomina phaseolina MS6]